MQTRMRRLEGVRLEVDSRRRTVVDLRHSIDAKRGKAQTPKLEFQAEQLIKKMQHKENKLASTSFMPGSASAPVWHWPQQHGWANCHVDRVLQPLHDMLSLYMMRLRCM